MPNQNFGAKFGKINFYLYLVLNTLYNMLSYRNRFQAYNKLLGLNINVI